MNRSAIRALSSAALGLILAGTLRGTRVDDVSPAREIPAAFAPLEYLVGRWHGHGVPKDSAARQFRGWPETHAWAWVFARGKPAAMSVSIEGGRILAAGKLSFDAARKLYRLEAKAVNPAGAPLVLEGTLDAAGKLLVLESVGQPAKGTGKLRVSFRPNANFVRYTLWEDRQEPGAVQFRRTIEVGLTREGESLADGATASERPKCIVTGGAASLTVSFQGQTYPICCSGCRAEFEENPEKYIKKAALMLKAQASSPKPGKAVTPHVSRFEDAFANDVEDTKIEAPAARGAAAAPASKVDDANSNAPAAGKSPDAGIAGKGARRKEAGTTAANSAARAATLFRLGQNFERRGRIRVAYNYYRRIVKEFPGTPAAKSAAERIKAIGEP